MKWQLLVIPTLIGLITFMASWMVNKPNVAYVDLEKVFNEFEMKKELQKPYNKEVNFRRAKLDSAKLELAQLKTKWELDKGNTELYDILMYKWQYNEEMAKQTEEEIEELTTKFDMQIQNQLKQFLNDFGKAKNVDILLGVTQDGTVLYGSNKSDYTNEAISYLNEKYLDK